MGKEVRDPVIENKILKGLNRRVRDRRTYQAQDLLA